jgi:hypothetical protein
MTVDKLIQKADYNDIRNKVVGVLGPGSASFGYGQTVRSTAVNEGTSVTINEWDRLRTDIINAYVHQNGSTPSLSTVTEGGTVRSNPTNSPYTQYDTIANGLQTNRFLVAGSQSSTTSKGSVSITFPGPEGSLWNSSLQCVVTATFTSATAARYFFNSGGQIRFFSSRAGGSDTAQNTAWTSLLSSAGTQSFGPVGINSLYYNLTSSYIIFYTVSSSSPYTSNVYRILARTPSVANNSSGTASTVEFVIQWIDGYTDSGPLVSENPVPGDQVDGTINLAISTLQATGVLIPPAAGNFVVESPTISIGAITTATSTPIYRLTPSVTSVNEGGSVTFNFNGFLVPNGDYSYNITGQVVAADFTDNTLTGTFTIANNAGSVTKTLSSDATSEGPEVTPNTEAFRMELKSGTTVLTTSSPVIANDTSLTAKFVYNPTFTSDISDVYLRDYVVGAGWNGTQPVQITMTVNPGVVMSGSQIGNYALRLGSYPAGSSVVLVNNGYILGRGGNGGDGAYYVNVNVAQAGFSGSHAIWAESAVTIYNYGVISGGGGGGGGGGAGNLLISRSRFGGSVYGNYGGGGGGGGRGGRNGATGGAFGPGPSNRGANGGTSTFDSAGGGGAGYLANSNGGGGGNWGVGGSGGSNGTSAVPNGFQVNGAAGGASGYAAAGNSNINWAVVGDRRGTLVA